MKLYDHYLKELQEGKSASVTKITRATKIKRVQGQLAVKMAKDKNDPLYDKMIKFRGKWESYKERIQKKYGPRVRAKARK